MSETTTTIGLPLDNLQRQGIALTPQYDDEEIVLVQKRLNVLFDELREDSSRMFGACICWAVELDTDEELGIDYTVQKTAELQNHGMVTKKTESYGNNHDGILWEGVDQKNGTEFIIAKRRLPIALDDSTVAFNGLTYSLLGARK
jgi:hypothetical protein